MDMPQSDERADVAMEAKPPRRRRISMRVQLIAALVVVCLMIYGFSRMHQALAELAK